MQFEDLSNEVLLCIWEHLLDVEVIFSFSNINNRLNSLLHEYCGLYRKIDLRYSSLSLFHYFCQQILSVCEWRENLNILKLGNFYRCCQLNILTSEITKSLMFKFKNVQNHSENNSHFFIETNKYLKPIFPNLTSIVIVQTTHISDNCREILLYAVASGPTMRHFVWSTCSRQSYTSKAFSDWLFQCSHNLHSFQYTTRGNLTCFQLTYEDTLTNGYISHNSLINLDVCIVDFTTLIVFLHYLPQLQHLSKSIFKYFEINFRLKFI